MGQFRSRNLHELATKLVLILPDLSHHFCKTVATICSHIALISCLASHGILCSKAQTKSVTQTPDWAAILAAPSGYSNGREGTGHNEQYCMKRPQNWILGLPNIRIT